MYVNREAGLLRNLRPITNNSDDRPLDRAREAGSRFPGSQRWLVRRRQRDGVANRNTVDDV